MSKRKHEDGPEPAAVPAERGDESEPKAKKPKKEKKDKKEKKSSKTKTKSITAQDESTNASESSATKLPKNKSTSKQRRLAARAIARGEEVPASVTLPLDADGKPIKPISAKKEKKAAKAALAAASADEADEPEADAEAEQAAAKAAEATKKNRFIVFIGNLPYTTTTAALEAHFASVKPASIRHITKPASAVKNANGFPESKGYAFVEFEDYDRLKTCLRSFHRSEFTCGGKMRQMNVELTAGGGGKGEVRKEKVRAKNEKLGEERKRRMVEEAKRKAERLEVNGEGEVVDKAAKKAAKEKKSSKKKSKQNDKPDVDVTITEPVQAPSGWGTADRGGMHPSRLAMLKA